MAEGFNVPCPNCGKGVHLDLEDVKSQRQIQATCPQCGQQFVANSEPYLTHLAAEKSIDESIHELGVSNRPEDIAKDPEKWSKA